MNFDQTGFVADCPSSNRDLKEYAILISTAVGRLRLERERS